MRGRQGVSLVEVLIGLIIVVVASVAALTYFAYGLGNINKQGNRRAALERTRQTLEQLLAANVDQIKPPTDGAMYEILCVAGTNPCAWSMSVAPVTEQTVVGQDTIVDDLPSRIAATVRWVDDPGTSDLDPANPTLDLLELTARVWFTPDVDPTNADEFNRVIVKTLRVP